MKTSALPSLLAAGVAFFRLSPVWKVGRKGGQPTQADSVRVRFGGKYRAAFLRFQFVGLPFF